MTVFFVIPGRFSDIYAENTPYLAQIPLIAPIKHLIAPNKALLGQIFFFAPFSEIIASYFV